MLQVSFPQTLHCSPFSVVMRELNHLGPLASVFAGLPVILVFSYSVVESTNDLSEIGSHVLVCEMGCF